MSPTPAPPLPSRQHKTLTLANIAEVDSGIPAAEFNFAVKTCMADLLERYGDEKERTITMAVKLTPKLGKQGQLDTVKVRFEINHNIPKTRSADYEMLPIANGALAFHPRSPFDPRQQAFDFDPRTGELIKDDTQTQDENQAAPPQA